MHCVSKVLWISKGKRDSVEMIFHINVVTHHENHLNEKVLMRGHNMFSWRNKKNSLNYPKYTFLSGALF